MEIVILKTALQSEVDRIKDNQPVPQSVLGDVVNGPLPPEWLMEKPADTRNPKTLMGLRKIPGLSVIPPAALLHLGLALRYGAYEAPRKDGSSGYGPYNWRDQPVEASVYVDAAGRHLMQFWDGEETDPKSKVSHLGHAMATIAILIDAIENGTCIDDRPTVRKNVASMILDRETKTY